MILFTSGLPKSGKTTFVNKLLDALDRKLCLHINPEDYYPEDFEKLSQEDKTDIATTAWEMSLEKATKSICAVPNRALIVFDTCCSKAFYMRQLFMNAKVRGHHVFLVYVYAPLEKRVERTGDKKLADLEERYRKAFGDTLPVLKGHSDEFIIIKNESDDLSELDKYAQLMCDKIKEIRSG